MSEPEYFYPANPYWSTDPSFARMVDLEIERLEAEWQNRVDGPRLVKRIEGKDWRAGR